MGKSPNQNDVLFGKGAAINAHPGNQRLRSMVDQQKQYFFAVERNQKRNVAAWIVNEVEKLGGRFLMEDPKGKGNKDRDGIMVYQRNAGGVHPSILAKEWICVEKDKAIVKVMHRLRERNVGQFSAQPTQGGSSSGLCSPSIYGSGQNIISSLGPTKRSNESGQYNKPYDIMLHGEKSQEVKESSSACHYGEGAKASSNNSSLQNEKGGDAGHIRHREIWNQYPQIGNERVPEKNPITSSIVEHNATTSDSILHSSHFGSEEKIVPIKSADKITGVTNGEEVKVPLQNLEQGKPDDVEAFLQFFSSHHDDPNKPRELTMSKWIEESKASLNHKSATSNLSYDGCLEYVKLALPIALKLTEFIIETEQAGRNPVPLASILAANVYIQVSSTKSRQGFENDLVGNLPPTSSHLEGIKGASVKSSPGDNPDIGTSNSRLFAFGAVMFELFSGESVKGMPIFDAASDFFSVNSISLNDESNCRPRKKSQRSEAVHSRCVVELERLGVPYSLRALVKNLLDSSQGDACGNETYTSMSNVLSDLHLMMEDPLRFLENIGTNPISPLMIRDKLYDREREVRKLEKSYENHMNRACDGVIITGRAGAGKSRLVVHVLQDISRRSNGYFLIAKFDQNKNVNPLATIGNLFNSLCDLFVQDATPSQLNVVDKELEVALGSQAGLLAGVSPSLTKIMPSSARLGFYSNCADMRFLFSELLRVIASHSKPISLFLDDIHWADPVSLLLIGSLIFQGSGSGFIVCSYRDNEVDVKGQFKQWLNSITTSSLQTIKVENMDVGGVNKLVSDALHLSPRITRPLSSVLYHKTRGNPLFLRQLLGSLKENGHIYVDLSCPRWMWDLDKIMDLPFSDNVLALLIEEMLKLPDSLQLVLKIASCIGSHVKLPILYILSKDVGDNLKDQLHQVSQRGFMEFVRGEMFTFTHDKIQQAAYELMTEQQRRENHMRFGLALCAHTMSSNDENDELFFAAINQINRGGESVVQEGCQKDVLARLNLKAGKRAINLSDYSTAFQLFKHGIAFLNKDHWETQYELSLDLFDFTSEAACVIHEKTAVLFYMQQLVDHARCYNDKVNCLYAATKAMDREASMISSFGILLQLGEPKLTPLGDCKLNVQAMNNLLQGMADISIYNLEMNNTKKTITLMKLYANLAHNLLFLDPSLIGATSLRMVELTLREGLCALSPLAFSFYGQVLASIEKLDLACRLGGLSLKLLNKKNLSSHKSHVIAMVYQFILWVNTPFQTIVDAHLLGYRAGLLSGDEKNARINQFVSITTGYVSGQTLSSVRNNLREFILTNQRLFFSSNHLACLFHSQVCSLINGVGVLNYENIDNVPGQKGLLAKANDPSLLLANKLHGLVRAFLFRNFDEVLHEVSFLEVISMKKMQLSPVFVFAIFVEGLISFHLARQTTDQDRLRWIAKGEAALIKMRTWNENCAWNFENKMLLLDAERRFLSGEFGHAESLYVRSIRSAKNHKFIHEEAMASELSGMFFYERGFHAKALSYFMHSVRCYKEWGACAVVRRVEHVIQSGFGTDFTDPGASLDETVSSFLGSEEGSKKRQELG